jgi:hypothetical protein
MSVLLTIQTQGEIRGRMEGNLEVNSLRSVRAMDLVDSDRVTLQAPSELVGQLPRTVTLNLDGDARYLLWIVLLFFVGGGIWLGWKGYDDVQQFKDRALLRSNGRDVVAEVTGLSYHRHGPTSVDYEFRFNGATYPGSAEEPNAGPGTSLHKSDKILVRFLPSNPAVNHPYAWEWSPAIGWVGVAFQVFFWAMGGAALVVLCRDRTLARKGHVASGVVTSCVLKDRFFHVEYEFRTADGAPMKGNTDRKEEYETGTRVWVLYLPQRPRRNDLYPLLLFDVAG